ncbi:putative membrane protein [Peptoniphilus sp. ING2-D1G]|nr:putative membrane protein [Peptoniphilus sp. ING2-D1G]
MLELYQPIANFGVLVVIAAMYLWQTPKTIEKVTKVIEDNTSVIRESRIYHERMERFMLDMKNDIILIKNSKNDEEIKEMIIRLEEKIDRLGK